MERIWEKYGKTEKQWLSFSVEARQRYIDRQGKERTPSKVETELKTITGTRSECAAGYLVSQCPELNAILVLLKKCGNGEKLRDFGFAITNYVTRDMKFDNMDDKIVAAISKLSSGAILAKVNSQRILLIPVTPLNFIDVISGHPGLKTAGTNGPNVKYHSGGGIMELPLANRVEAFAVVKEFLGFAGSSMRKHDYFVYPASKYGEMLTYLLLMNYKWSEGEESITPTERLAFQLPPRVDPALGGMMEKIVEMIADFMDPMIGKAIRLETYTNATIGAKVYVFVSTSNMLMENGAPTDLATEMEVLCLDYEEKIFVKTMTDNAEYKIWEKTADKAGTTKMFTDLKDNLEMTKNFREDFKVAAKLTRNWYTMADYVDIKEKRWGAAHNIMSILDTLRMFPLTQFDCVELVGPDADSIALCLNFLKRDGEDPFDGTHRKIFKKKGESAMFVPGWAVNLDDGTSLPNDSSLKGSDNYFYCATSYNDEKAKTRVVDRIRDTLTKVRNAKIGNYVLIFSGHLSGLSDITTITDMCKEFDCGMKMIRHPRLQNDKVFYIIAKKLPRDTSFLRTWYDAVICANDNAINYTWSMFTGIKPIVDATKYNKNLIKGMYVSLHLTDRGKGEGARGDRSGIKGEMLEMIKRQSAEDNNNARAPEELRKSKEPTEAPPEEKTETVWTKKRLLGEEEPARISPMDQNK